ncbi:MAG TPA: sulfite oxidase [Euzebya sp.]|nr:sulfite oxidase [Euzebya sp.]
MADAPAAMTADPRISVEELQLATRNHGMPLEALRHDVTPVGLHYLLIHYDIPLVEDADDWRVEVSGAVRQPLELSLADLHDREQVTAPVTLECAGNGRARFNPRAVSQPWLVEAVGTGRWTGTRLRALLADAALTDDAVEVVFTGADRGVEGGQVQHYQRSLTIEQATAEEVLVVWALNGQPLPAQHGFPVRLLVPGWYGMASVKWLRSIAVVTRPFTGYQQARAYRMRRDPDEPGEPVDRIVVRSLLLPPGIPDFMTRRRFVAAGEPCLIEGRAWSGQGPIIRVEVTTDGGRTWADATVHPADGPHAWHRFTWWWQDPARGDHRIASRATDASGDVQPIEPRWNLGGYAGTHIHVLEVTASA